MLVVDLDKLARRVRVRRAELGLSQSKVSEISEVHSSVISRLEHGQNLPDIATLMKISGALDTSVAYLLGETDDPKP